MRTVGKIALIPALLALAVPVVCADGDCYVSGCGGGHCIHKPKTLPSSQAIANNFMKGFNSGRDRRDRMDAVEKQWREEDRAREERLHQIQLEQAQARQRADEESRRRAEQLALEKAALLSEMQNAEAKRLEQMRQKLGAARESADIEEYQALLRLAENTMSAKNKNTLNNVWPGWKKQAADLAVSLAARGVPTEGFFTASAEKYFDRTDDDTPLKRQERRLADGKNELSELDEWDRAIATREIRAQEALNQKRITETEFHDRMAGISDERSRYMKQQGAAEAKVAYAEWQRARLAGETTDTTPPAVMDYRAGELLMKSNVGYHERESHRTGIEFREQKLREDEDAGRITPDEAARRQGMIDIEKNKKGRADK